MVHDDATVASKHVSRPGANMRLERYSAQTVAPRFEFQNHGAIRGLKE